MKRSLRNYNQLPDRDPVDKAAFWVSFSIFIGFSAGFIFAKFII